MDVRGQIAVAEIEPVGAAEDGQALQHMKCFVREIPSLLRIDDSSQRVGDDVEVGRDFQAVQHDVVAGVYDRRSVRSDPEHVVEAEQKFGGADAAGQRGDPWILIVAWNSVPEREPLRGRSVRIDDCATRSRTRR